MHKQLFFIVSIIAFAACARVAMPTGGVKDTSAPKLQSTIPANETTNFNRENNKGQIRLTFDEYVQLKSINSNLVVSPPLAELPEVRLKGKQVIVEMPDSLAENTTYVLDFGEAIADITEGNSEVIQYVFSTGEAIDSLGFTGTILDAFTQKPVENASILVYTVTVDSLPKTTFPNYFGRTDKQGNFSVSYLKPGTYSVYALNDANGNLTFDLPVEGFAFADSATVLIADTNSLVPNIAMNMFVGQQQLFKFTEKKRKKAKEFRLGVSQMNDSLSVISLDDVGDLFYKLAEKGDSISIWLSEEPTDSIRFCLMNQGLAQDTTTIFYRSKSNAKEKPTVVKIPKPVKFIGAHETVLVEFNLPISIHDSSLISLTKDSVEVPFSMSQPSALSLEFNVAWQPESTYKLLLDSTAVKAAYSNEIVLDSTLLSFEIKPTDFFGLLEMNLNFENEGTYIFELLDDKGNVVEREILNSSQTLTYTNRYPGTFSARVFKDINNDGKWTTGNFEEKCQPEPIAYYIEPIKIRSNWDLKLSWEVSL